MVSDWFRRFGAVPGTAPDAAPASENGMRLFCFPHAGGAASSYGALAKELTPGLDVIAVQYPGRHDRHKEKPLESVTELVDALLGELLPLDGRPYAFFGHSMGAVLGYELARALAERELPGPRRLFLSGRFAPTPLGSSSDRLDTDEAVIAMVRRLGGTGTQFLDDPELLDLVLPPLRADYRAIGSYAWVPGRPLTTPVTVLVGDSDPVVPVADAAAWRTHTTAETDVRVLPGGHFYLDSRTAEVAGIIRSALDPASVPAF